MGTKPKRSPLSETHPELTAEAMFDPTTITAGSPKKALWKCAAYGHQWEAQVKHRTAAFGTGCPVCCNQKVLADFNDLQTTHPEIAQEANFDPTTVIAGSNKKMSWICAARGHEWEASPANRTKAAGTGCPVCSGRVVLPYFNDLATTHPDFAREANFDPTTVVAGSNKKMSWKCATHGHEWEVSVDKRTGRNQGCPVCSNNKVLIGFNDLETTHPDLAREANFDPATVVAGSNKKMPWKCVAHGHEWKATVISRTWMDGTGCPACSNQKVHLGFNDLQTTHPDLAREANFDPATVVAGSNKKMQWKCVARGHEWETKVSHRTGPKGSGCPVCSNRAVLAGFNDLQTTHPDLAREADFDPTTVVAGSHKKMPWKCATYEHKWVSIVKDRIGKDATGCPLCSGRQVLPGFNDLQTTHPEIAQEANFDPATVVAGSNKKMPWKCGAHGHEWETTVNHRTGGKQGCPVCSNYEVLAGFNDLQTTHPDLAREADFDPTTVVAGSHKKMPWKCCICGWRWKATVGNRALARRACPHCAETGFDPGDPAWLYLMRHPEWLLQQVGITNHPDIRLNKHASNGWEALDIRGPMDGVLTQQWEASILRWLSFRNIARASSGTSETPYFDNRNTGEAWQQSDLNVTSVREIMDLVESDEPRHPVQ